MLNACCTGPCSGAERRDKVLDEVSTKIHGGAAAVKERLYFTNKPSLTLLLTSLPCLKAPFWHQKVRPKPFFAHIFDNITHKNNNLSGSNPLIYPLISSQSYFRFQHHPGHVPGIIFGFPLKHRLGLGRVCTNALYIGGTYIPGIDPDIFFPIQL